MAMDQKAWEAMEKADLCRDGHELFRIANQRTMEKTDVVGVSYLEDKSGAVKVSGCLKENPKGKYGKNNKS